MARRSLEGEEVIQAVRVVNSDPEATVTRTPLSLNADFTRAPARAIVRGCQGRRQT